MHELYPAQRHERAANHAGGQGQPAWGVWPGELAGVMRAVSQVPVQPEGAQQARAAWSPGVGCCWGLSGSGWSSLGWASLVGLGKGVRKARNLEVSDSRLVWVWVSVTGGLGARKVNPWWREEGAMSPPGLVPPTLAPPLPPCLARGGAQTSRRRRSCPVPVCFRPVCIRGAARVTPEAGGLKKGRVIYGGVAPDSMGQGERE